MALDHQMGRELVDLNLNPAELVFVQCTLQGYSPHQVADRFISGEFDVELNGFNYPKTHRAYYNWIDRPAIQAALARCVEIKQRSLDVHHTQKMQIVLPKARDQLLEMVPEAIEAIKEVLVGAAGRCGRDRLAAAQLVLKLAGVVETTTTTTETESVKRTGITEDIAQQIRSRVLYGKAEVSIGTGMKSAARPPEPTPPVVVEELSTALAVEVVQEPEH